MRTQKEQDRRRARRKRRIQIFVIYTAIAIGLAWFFESQATTTIIFVRHAEQTNPDEADPPLSEAGRRRVAELTRQLVDADVVAGIDAIYSTELKRATETAQPLADRLGLPINIYDGADTETVLEDILKAHKGKIILVVGPQQYSAGTDCKSRCEQESAADCAWRVRQHLHYLNSLVWQDQDNSPALWRALRG